MAANTSVFFLLFDAYVGNGGLGAVIDRCVECYARNGVCRAIAIQEIRRITGLPIFYEGGK